MITQHLGSTIQAPYRHCGKSSRKQGNLAARKISLYYRYQGVKLFRNTKLWQHIKKQRHHFADKSPYGQSCGFASSHIRMWELDHNEGWALKNWCFQTVVLERTLESPLDYKEITPVNPKGNQSWIPTGRTDAEAEAPTLWPPDVKFELTHWKRPWCWERFKVVGEGDDRGWDGWMASPTQWTWLWAGSWWWTVKPGMW